MSHAGDGGVVMDTERGGFDYRPYVSDWLRCGVAPAAQRDDSFSFPDLLFFKLHQRQSKPEINNGQHKQTY